MDHSRFHPCFSLDSLVSWGDRGGGGTVCLAWGSRVASPVSCRIRAAPLEGDKEAPRGLSDAGVV